MKGLLLGVILTLLTASSVRCQDATNSTKIAKKEKSFQFLTVVKFPNDPCVAGGNRNGTCYTSDECLSKGGLNSGSCANGYGVCCVFTLACGKTSSENCTYLTLGATTTTPVPAVCDYRICRCNPNICRLRLDFMTFSITGPVTGQTVAAGAANSQNGGAIGDCITDTFTVTSPGGRGSPVICGTNTGQHIYVDASQECNRIVFNFGTAAFNRQYDIKVTQYSCQDEIGGPSDCLQFFTSNTGTIQSFNFQTKNNAVTSMVTHLSSQCYTMCFRRNLNKCGICFTPTIDPQVGAGVINQASFGLSITSAIIAQAEVDTNCISDYLVIPNSLVTTLPIAPMVNLLPATANRYCGRFLNIQGVISNVGMSVCTFMRPFKVTFKTDANEVTNAITTPDVNEQSIFPGGIIGFQLTYNQISC